MEDNVNHPSHYTWLKEKAGIEVIDITRHLSFDRGNAVKYLLRAGRKGSPGSGKEIEDLKKAIWYIQDEIKQLEKDTIDWDSMDECSGGDNNLIWHNDGSRCA